MNAERLAEMILRGPSRKLDNVVCIEHYSPGHVGGRPVVDVYGADYGFDWDNGKFIITPDCKLTKLTQEEVQAIKESAGKAQSWHMFKAYEEHAKEVKSLKAKIKELEGLLNR